MKKLILLVGISALIATSAVNHVFAQVSTAPVTVSIDLTAPVISITLGADPNVTFVYDSPEDYTTPQVVNKPGHFTVVSNQDYEISVVAQGEFTVNAANDDPIPLEVVQVAVDPSTTGAGTTEIVPLTTAASDATILATDAPATTATLYNINYTIPDATPLLDKFPQVYSTTVVYTATQL
ncbi:hypothetical protein GCM10007415_45190 [Parapedobacter pyrenivorans]|uniref:DUF4397 domain-containing protein n=1 Tax=Parapedobacter pyrenivorans TaxID=1305674 RepID=A0A917MES9_9SPHI|nr:hypothetical protein [Parapedobacter pyrenivorans]GGH03970.1 hypothetical protein GCM10007415_45190 [Parapedobacter pyrenivorans]